jgi:hypothetical protein
MGGATWGLQKLQMQDLPKLAPSLEEEDGKPRIDGPMKESVANCWSTTANHKKAKEKGVDIKKVKTKHIPRVLEEWSQSIQPPKLGSRSPL